MPITEHEKEKLKARLGKASGHLKHVYHMVDEKRYCIDILQQLKAVQAALNKTAELILRKHLESCVVDAIKNQDPSTVIEELVQVFREAPTLYEFNDDIAELPAPKSDRDYCH